MLDIDTSKRSPMWSVDRSDWVLSILALGIACVAGCWPLVEWLRSLVTSGPLRITTHAAVPPPVVDDPALGEGVSGTYTGEAEFLIAHPDLQQWLGSLLMPLVSAGIAIACVVLALGLLREINQGRFTDSARNKGRAGAIVLFGYGLFGPLLNLFALALVTTPMSGGRLSVTFRIHPLDGWPIVVGIVVWLIVELAWRRGSHLESEAEGLV